MKTGRFFGPKPELFITQRIGTRYSGNGDVCDETEDFPLVKEFLNSLFDDRSADLRDGIVDNLQIFLGYALSGVNTHHNVLFLHGEGILLFFISESGLI